MFGGETKRKYRENKLAYIISKESHLVNHPIYAVDTDFGSCILQIDDNQKTSVQLTKPYHDLFSFDSRKVKCLGLIKDLAVNLTQLPSKSVMMDIVVADIPPKFGLLLSQSWRKILGDTL